MKKLFLALFLIIWLSSPCFSAVGMEATDFLASYPVWCASPSGDSLIADTALARMRVITKSGTTEWKNIWNY